MHFLNWFVFLAVLGWGPAATWGDVYDEGNGEEDLYDPDEDDLPFSIGPGDNADEGGGWGDNSRLLYFDPEDTVPPGGWI